MIRSAAFTPYPRPKQETLVGELLFPLGVDKEFAMNFTRCPQYKMPRKIMLNLDGRTDFLCLECHHLDPLKTGAVKWANNPLAPPYRSM
jgi:hypothetical protein